MALCGCFGRSHRSKPRPQAPNSRASWNTKQPSQNFFTEPPPEDSVPKRPKAKNQRYILRQNTLGSYLDVMFFTPETGGEDIIDEDTYLPDVNKKLVVIFPWVTPRDTVLMDYCMLYLNYSTDVMVVRYGIQDLLNLQRMREMSTELGFLLRKYCPSYNAVICHSIQGGTFILCDLLSRNLLVNISAIIVERLTCDWINLPLDGLMKHSSSSSIIKRLSFRHEHELSADLRDAILNPDDSQCSDDPYNVEDAYRISSQPINNHQNYPISDEENPYISANTSTLPKKMSYAANSSQSYPVCTSNYTPTNNYYKPHPNFVSNSIQRRATTNSAFSKYPNRANDQNGTMNRHSIASTTSPDQQRMQMRCGYDQMEHYTCQEQSIYHQQNHPRVSRSPSYLNPTQNGTDSISRSSYRNNVITHVNGIETTPSYQLNQHQGYLSNAYSGSNHNSTQNQFRSPRSSFRENSNNQIQGHYGSSVNGGKGNGYNFYSAGNCGTLNSRYSIQSQSIPSPSIPSQSNQSHATPQQLFWQHSQSFMEHSTTAMTSFSSIIPHMRVPVLIFATGKDNCDVDGIKSMISTWRFQGVKVTLRYWRKCTGVSLLESHNSAFMKTLDSFLEFHQLIEPN